MVAQVDRPLPAANRPEGNSGEAVRRWRVMFSYRVAGDQRFLSHHDELRVLTRALVRARWPLAYSQGFNPKPHLNIPLPRNVGVGAETQLAVVDLREPEGADTLQARLAAALPTGFDLHAVIAPATPATPHPVRATYELQLASADSEGARRGLARVLAAATLPINRDYGPQRRPRPIDIRPYIENLRLDGSLLQMHLCFAEQRTARPVEVLTELGLTADQYAHRLWRSAVHWDTSLAAPEGPAADTRIQVGYEENNDQEDQT